MQMPGRKYQATGSYRYGSNGKENDNDVKDGGNQQDYGMRIYDPRLVKFLSVDPIAADYPELTPYQFAHNTPIQGIDLDGLELVPHYDMDKLVMWSTTKLINKVKSFIQSSHKQGTSNVKVAEYARSQAVKQGRQNGDGITWWTKSMVYIAPFWGKVAPMSDANDGAVLISGKNLDCAEAGVADYGLAGVGIFIPFVSGSSMKNVFKGFSTSVEGYKYGAKTFKNAEQFGKAVTELAGTPREKRALIETVTREVAGTNGWKKSSSLSGTALGDEVYDLGNATFGSVDKYHGNFEIFKQKGKSFEHQGSIDIDGVKNKERNSNYDVKL